MKQTKAAIRYAKSFLSLSKEQGTMEATREDMELVKTAISESKDLRMLLSSPIIKADKKLKIVQSVFAGKIGEFTMKFLGVIISKGRDSIISEIAHEFVELCKIDNGISDAHVTAAHPLNDEQRAQVREMAQKIKPGKIEITETIDESLIGGFIIRIGDQMIDTSLKKQLRNARQEFTDSSYISTIN